MKIAYPIGASPAGRAVARAALREALRSRMAMHIRGATAYDEGWCIRIHLECDRPLTKRAVRRICGAAPAVAKAVRRAQRASSAPARVEVLIGRGAGLDTVTIYAA